MPVYQYKAVKNKTVTKGFYEGHLGEIRKRLIDDGFIILNLKEVETKHKKNRNITEETRAAQVFQVFDIRKRIKSKKLAEFSAQLSILLDAGMTIPESIKVLARNEKNKRFKQILKRIESQINQGVSLSDSIRNIKNEFPPMFEMALKTGEYSGNISSVLNQMADYFEKIDDNKSKIVSTSIYPSILMLFLGANLIVMSIKVIPVFRELFAGFEDKLPFTTLFIFNVADFIRNNYLLLIAMVLLIPLLILVATRNPVTKNILDMLILRIPVIRRLSIDTSVNSFLRSMYLLINSGMTIFESLEPSINTVGNKVVRDSIWKDTRGIIEGKPLHELIKDNKYIGDIAKTLIETGENSARIDATIEKAIYYYNREIDRRIDRINRLIEPVLIVFLGIIIGVVVISLAIPIFKISSGSLME